MAKTILIGGAVLGMLAAVVLGLALIHPAKGAGPKAGLWKPFQSADGRFMVSLPGDPTETAVPKNGGEVRQASLLNEDNSFSITRAIHPGMPALDAEERAAKLEDYASHFADPLKGEKLVRDEQIDWAGGPAREIESMDSHGLTTRMRILFADGQFYTVAIYGAGVHSKEADQFFGSFQIMH